MEEEACIFSKFGHCKFKERCKRNHYSEICKQNQACQSIKTCPKRHPKKCKTNYTDQGCRFGFDCSYEHNQVTNKDCEKAKVKLKEKVDLLENSVVELNDKVECMKGEKFEQLDKVVRALTRKVLSLENELEELKRNSVPRKVVKEPGVSNKVKEKKVETREVELEENCSKNKASFHNNDIKDKCSTPKEKKEKDKKDHGKEEKTCTECSYVYNKETTLKKHMNAKHEEHQCKECHLKLSTFMEIHGDT